MLPRYVITRFAADPPRLFELTGKAPPRRGRVHGRDVMTGRRLILREADILGGDDDLDIAFARFEAVKAAARELDAGLAAARRAYDRAWRRREAELRRLAEGPPAPAPAQPVAAHPVAA